MNTLELANVTKDTPHLIPLLKRAYQELFVPAFPDTDDEEGINKFLDVLDGKYPSLDIVLNLIGTDLGDEKKAQIAAISAGYYFKDHNVGLLAFNAVNPETREGGLGKTMVQTRIASMQTLAKSYGNKSLSAVFLEVNNPDRVPEGADGMDPHKRIAIFEKWGARKIDIEYAQPPFKKSGTEFCRYMDLYSYPVNGRYAQIDDMRGFLLGSFSRAYGKPETLRTELRRMFNEISNLKPEGKLPKGFVPGYCQDARTLQPVM